jgi:hypothetical protein
VDTWVRGNNNPTGQSDGSSTGQSDTNPRGTFNLVLLLALTDRLSTRFGRWVIPVRSFGSVSLISHVSSEHGHDALIPSSGSPVTVVVGVSAVAAVVILLGAVLLALIG